MSRLTNSLHDFSQRRTQLLELGVNLQKFLTDSGQTERSREVAGHLMRLEADSVKIAVVGRREFNRQIQPVTHELNVAMDGLGGNFDFARELAGIGKSAGLQRLMNAQHPLQRRARMERGAGGNDW